VNSVVSRSAVIVLGEAMRRLFTAATFTASGSETGF
jgi:hypothetical protein